MSSLEPSKELISELAVRRSDRKRKIIKSDYRSELADIDDFISDSDDEYNIDDDDSESDCKWKTDTVNSSVLKKRVRKAKAPPDLTAFNTSTKGKYKCWLCKKTFLKCIGGKAHIIKKHKQGFCTIDMVQVEETNEPHLLLYCPRECKYATFSLEGLKNHLANCEKPLLKEDGENWLEINTNFIDTLYPELLKTGINDLLGASNAKPATKDPAKVVKRKKKKSTSESVTSTASVLISHGEAQVTVEPDDNVIKVSKTSAEQATSNSTPIKTFGATQVTGSVTANMCDTLASSTISSPQSLSLGSPCHIPIVSRPHLVSNMHQQILNAHPIPLHPQSGLTQSGSTVQAQFVARQSVPLSHPRIAYSQNAHTNNVHSQVPKSQQSNSRFVTPSIRQDTPRFSQSLSVASSTSSSSKQMPPSSQQQQYRFEQSNFAPRIHHPGAFDTSSPVNRHYSHPIPRPNHHLKAVNQSLKPNVRVVGQQEAFSAPHKPTVAHQHGANQSRTCQDADIYMIEDNGTICIE
ncbi:unnamed protein product [Lymnaea stagnalis]|uniref:C2H2-type domain-containing protein n=1 Tax=Lymnaea stagnalis TaxID=6523 RepID=A0AAV2IDY8_LYMST